MAEDSEEEEKNNKTLEERLRSSLSHLQTESGILERMVYKNKNQHRRCPHFKPLLKVRSDLKLLLQLAKLEEIFNYLFPIVNGNQVARKAFFNKRQKKNTASGKHNHQERLLGVARLLSQMVEPILKAAIQISFLLAKSFFPGFSLTILSLLARLRVLVQQMFVDVVSVFNKVSLLSQKKHAIQLTKDGNKKVQAFMEYYPLSGDVLTLECVWKEDKFVLLERKSYSKVNNEDEDLATRSLEAPIQYETVPLFSNEVQSPEHEQISETIPMNSPPKESCPLENHPSVGTKDDTYAIVCERFWTEEPHSEGNLFTSGLDCQGFQSEEPLPERNLFTSALDCQRFQSEEPHSEEKLFTSGDSVAIPELQSESRKKVAFIRVGMRREFETEASAPNKKMKLELPPSKATEAHDDPLFPHLLNTGSTDTTQSILEAIQTTVNE